jgi:hypothetical protein
MLKGSTVSCAALLFGCAPCAIGGAQAAVTISTSATQNMSCSAGVCSPTATNAVLNVNDLENLLASGSVEITTTGSGGVQASDIVVASGYSWSSANGLTLDAYHSISVDQPIAVNGSGAVSLATNDGTGGTLSFISGGSLSFAQTANALSINGVPFKLENSLPALAAAIKKKPSGRFALSAGYNASQDGIYEESPIPTKFKGTFNGLGNTIANLMISSNKPEIGLFGYVTAMGAINSLLLTKASIAVKDERKNRQACSAGILAAINLGTVFDSFAGGKIDVTMGERDDSVSVGGLIGENLGTIVNSAAAPSLFVTTHRRSPGTAFAGGLAGTSSGEIMGSYATANISVNAAGYAGDLLGLGPGIVINSYATGQTAISGSVLI